MKKEEYLLYIQSLAWFNMRRARIDLDGGMCFICNLRPDDSCLNVHHLTYERVGHEDFQDLITLCIRCHKEIHMRPSYDKGDLYQMKEEYDERTMPKSPDTTIIEKRRKEAEDFLQFSILPHGTSSI